MDHRCSCNVSRTIVLMMLPQQQQFRNIANEFWYSNKTWKTLPQRIRTLLSRIVDLQNMLLQKDREHQLNHLNNVDTTHVFIDLCTAITAAIFASQPKPKFLMSSFESLFVASLTYHSISNDDHDRELLVDDEFPKSFVNSNEEVFYDNLRTLRWILMPSSFDGAKTYSTVPLATSSFLHEPLMNSLHKIIKKKVHTMIAGNFDLEDDEVNATSSYQSILLWTDHKVLPWLLRFVFGMHDNIPNDNDRKSENRDWRRYVQHGILHPLVAHCYWSVRLDEIFDIVTSYPESLPAVLELKSVLTILLRDYDKKDDSADRSELRMQELSHALRESFVRRLNHPGANTTQMIDVYIAAIQVLRLLLDDHTSSPNHMNTFIAYTTEPVRSYLRNYRNDTVRCILTNLTNTGNGVSSMNNENSSNHVLYQELRRQDTKPLEYMAMNSDDEEDDEEECPTMDWQPRPSINSYAHHQQQLSYHYHRSSSSNTKNKDSDILAMLVGIYGSKELFVNEYRSMLADKMLCNLEYNTDDDIHTLELLKLRFGEMSLINAEVMIKDIEDSARLNKNIRDAALAKKSVSTTATDSPMPVVVDAAVVSHIFWPKLHNGPLKHHPRIQVLLDEYANIYAEQKNPRTLHWLYHLGSVQMELDVVEESRHGTMSTMVTKEFTCSPFLATLISHFEDEPTWSADQLMNETNVPDHIIVKQMSYWIKQRVVMNVPISAKDGSIGGTSTNNYNASRVVYTLLSKNHDNVLMTDNDNDDTSNGLQQLVVSSTHTTQEEVDYYRYESYILVMLANLQLASIQKINEMLIVMSSQSGASASKCNLSATDLHALLQKLCRQKKLECGPDGMYKLAKK